MPLQLIFASLDKCLLFVKKYLHWKIVAAKRTCLYIAKLQNSTTTQPRKVVFHNSGYISFDLHGRYSNRDGVLNIVRHSRLGIWFQV